MGWGERRKPHNEMSKELMTCPEADQNSETQTLSSQQRLAHPYPLGWPSRCLQSISDKAYQKLSLTNLILTLGRACVSLQEYKVGVGRGEL